MAHEDIPIQKNTDIDSQIEKDSQYIKDIKKIEKKAKKKEKEEKNKKRKRILLILLLILLLLLGIVACMHEYGNLRFPWEPKGIISGTKGKLPGRVDSGDGDEGNVTFVINSMPVFAKGGEKGSLMIENPETNLYDIRVEIYLGSDNTGELIYKTNSIPPGYYIDYDVLLKELPKGTHPAIAYMTFYNGELAASSAASVNLEIIVKN